MHIDIFLEAFGILMPMPSGKSRKRAFRLGGLRRRSICMPRGFVKGFICLRAHGDFFEQVRPVRASLHFRNVVKSAAIPLF